MARYLGLGQQNVLCPRPHLFVLPSFVKPPPQEDLIPAMLVSPGKHCPLQSLESPPLLSPRQLQFFGASFEGQQTGLPQC